MAFSKFRDNPETLDRNLICGETIPSDLPQYRFSDIGGGAGGGKIARLDALVEYSE
jgi:hypothetical protein